MKTKPIKNGEPKYPIYKYTVIQFEDEDEEEKLFECIPDRWFVDETKSQCYWPPLSGKPFSLRAINCEKPDIVTWSEHTCRVISSVTYNDGLKLVREKCDQKYNTSSADEHINAAIYRRQHPVLAIKNRGNIEHIFAKPSSEKQTQNKQHKSNKISSKKSKENYTESNSTPQLTIVSSSGVGSSKSSNIDIGNGNVEESDHHKSDNDFSLDYGNETLKSPLPVGVDSQTETIVIPDITPKGSDVVMTDSASVRFSNQSRSSHPRSDGSRLSVSPSEGSRSSHSYSKGRQEIEKDLSLDCNNQQILKSKVCDDGQAETTNTPEITPKASEVVITDSTSVRSLNQSRSSSPRSDRSRPRVSRLEESRSSYSRSKGSRSSHSRSKGSRSSHSRSERSRSSHSRSYARSSKSRTNRSRSSRSPSSHCSSLKRFQSSRYRSNVSRSRSDSNRPRKDFHSNNSKQRPSDSNRRSRSIESSFSGSVRSVTKNGSPQNWAKKHNKNNSSSKTSRKITNSRMERTNNIPNENGRQSNTNNKFSASRRLSNLPDSRSQSIQYISSRSRSKESCSSRHYSKSSRFRSRSRTPIRREANNNQQRRQSQDGQEMSSNKGRTISNYQSRSNMQQRLASSEYSRSRSRSSFSSPHQSHNSSKTPKNSSKSNCEKNIRETSNQINSMADLWNVVGKLNETVNENNQQLRDYDRRLHRMEVTLNKTFVLVGDLSGNTRPMQDELLNDQGFEIPKLPIEDLKELAVLKRKLREKEFRDFLLQHEKDFCCPTQRSTDTVTISKYLKRFISLSVRTEITLKESGENGLTLFNDFHTVYLFLIDVMKAGYRLQNKTISNSDAHSALRIVWGRSKQLFREQRPRRPSRSRKSRRPHRSRERRR